MSQFDVYNTQVRNILGWISSDEVSIPEIQRPFVWNATKVRDFMDSLYRGLSCWIFNTMEKSRCALKGWNYFKRKENIN